MCLIQVDLSRQKKMGVPIVGDLLVAHLGQWNWKQFLTFNSGHFFTSIRVNPWAQTWWSRRCGRGCGIEKARGSEGEICPSTRGTRWAGSLARPKIWKHIPIWLRLTPCSFCRATRWNSAAEVQAGCPSSRCWDAPGIGPLLLGRQRGWTVTGRVSLLT